MNLLSGLLIEASAAGSFLQSFYNGIESIVALIFKAIKENIPNDSQWHKKLFEKMFEPNEKRTAIFRNENKEQLCEIPQIRISMNVIKIFNNKSAKIRRIFKRI